MNIKLRPVDTFFFKNHQTTEAGSDSFMQGIFPPRPNTIYGSLRAAYIHANTSFEAYKLQEDATVKAWMGTPEELGDFEIQHVTLFHENKELLPLPLDYQVFEEEDGLAAKPLVLTNDSTFNSNGTAWHLFSQLTVKAKGSEHIYIDKDSWKKALLTKSDMTNLQSLAKITVQEPKIGIAVDHKTKQVKDKHLYQLTKLRFKEDGGLNVYLTQAPSFEDITFARVGGENRPWTIKQQDETFVMWNTEELQAIRSQIEKTQLVKFVFLAPSIWLQGSRPASFANGEFMLHGINFEWLTAAIGRPSLYGGWDIVKNRPKERYYMIPEGSVVYAKLKDITQLDTLMTYANGSHFTDKEEKQGFGFAIIAAI